MYDLEIIDVLEFPTLADEEKFLRLHSDQIPSAPAEARSRRRRSP